MVALNEFLLCSVRVRTRQGATTQRTPQGLMATLRSASNLAWPVVTTTEPRLQRPSFPSSCLSSHPHLSGWFSSPHIPEALSDLTLQFCSNRHLLMECAIPGKPRGWIFIDLALGEREELGRFPGHFHVFARMLLRSFELCFASDDIRQCIW